ncbi:MAG: DUF2891 domain-containing protein, partial [Myxococcota bacterium]
SSVHGHWLLVRLLKKFPEATFATRARNALSKSLTVKNVRGEVVYLKGEGRNSFERPYGLAWLLQLSSELHSWDTPAGKRWAEVIEPLEAVAVERLLDWFPKLTFPIRTGEHSQTAFAMGLIADWAKSRKHLEMATLISTTAQRFYAEDRDYPLRLEPSGQDFLSPGWAEADLARRFMSPELFATWLDRFLPELGTLAGSNVRQLHSGLVPAEVSDATDGKLAHLDGLNLSRAWMIEGVLAGLPQDDPRRALLGEVAGAHREAGLAAVTGEHYAGGHWLGSFAVYLVSGAGVPVGVDLTR